MGQNDLVTLGDHADDGRKALARIGELLLDGTIGTFFDDGIASERHHNGFLIHRLSSFRDLQQRACPGYGTHSGPMWKPQPPKNRPVGRTCATHALSLYAILKSQSASIPLFEEAASGNSTGFGLEGILRV